MTTYAYLFASVAAMYFFAEAGLDYVSCSPFRVPVARLEAGRAEIGPFGLSYRRTSALTQTTPAQ